MSQKGKKLELNKGLFWPTLIATLFVAALCVIFPDRFISVGNFLLGWVLNNFGWFILAVSVIIFLVLIWLAFTPFGKRIVGGPNAERVYKSNFTWFSVILCSSIGIAIVFWAVYEPLSMYMNLPQFAIDLGIQPGSNGAALFCIAETTWHWCAPYYAVQMIWGLMIVYLSIEKGLPYRPSTALYPVLGNKIFSTKGTAIDVMCLVAQLFATITCMGIAAIQVAASSSFIFPGLNASSLSTQIVITIICSVFFIFTSASGMKKGISYLSDINTYIYIVLLLFLFLAGPTVRLLEGVLGSLGMCLDILPISWLNLDMLGTNGGFGNNNTAYYWVWSLAFGPLTGSFYAKSCIGRSYRQFILGIIGGSFIFLLFWFVAWGGSAIYMQDQLGIDIWGGIAAAGGLEASNWVLLSNLPLAKITVPLASFCALIGFVTMTQSINNSLASCTTKMSRRLDPPMSMIILWGSIMCIVTVILLGAVARTGLSALQSATVAFAIIIMVITLFVVAGYFKIAYGQMDKVLAETEQGKRTYELVAQQEGSCED